MKKVLKAYHVKLKTVGPVFVGSGRELTKKEYLFLPQNKVGVLDTVKLYQFMKQRKLHIPFEDYMVNDFRQDLGQWLRRYRIDFKEIKPCMKYVLDSGDTVLQRGTKTSIMENMKDSYGLPYIPGSTIKGMLRTVLLTGAVMEQPMEYSVCKQNLKESLLRADRKVNRNSYLQKDVKQIETKSFHLLQREGTRATDAVNDILSGMIVGDSAPIHLERIVLCQRIERHVDGTEKTLNLLRECIRPETTIEFMLTLDASLCKITIEDIYQAIKNFNACYNDCFLSAYQGIERLQDDNLFLGGGIGFVSKTVIYPMLDKKEGIKATQMIFENTKVPQNHKHYKDAQLGVSPHILKCTRYEGSLLQMGLCKIVSIEEMD